MMEKLPPLRMYWLGHPRVELDGKPLKFEMRKALALLVYLSLENRPVSRETLATLFWPEFSQQNALANLRRNLSSLETTLPGGWLMASRETISLTHLEKTWIDTQSFCQ